MTFDAFISALESIRTIYSVSLKGGFSSDEESDVRIRILEELSKLKTFAMNIIEDYDHPSYLKDLDTCKDAIIEWDPQGPWLRETPSVVKTLDLIISGSIQIASQIQDKLKVDTSEVDINMVQISTEIQQLKEILKTATSMLETLENRVYYLLDKQHSVKLKTAETPIGKVEEVTTDEETFSEELSEIEEEEKSDKFDIYYDEEETEQSLDDNIRSIIEQKLGSGPASDDYKESEDETSDILVKGITSYFSKSKGFASEVHKAVKETDPSQIEKTHEEPPTRLSQLIDIASLEKQIARFRKEVSIDEEISVIAEQPIDHKLDTEQLDDVEVVDSSDDTVDLEQADILTEEDFMNEDLATLRVKHEVLLSEISMMRIYLLLPDYDTQGIRQEIDAKLYNARLIKNRILELDNNNST
ncbi:MAG: hypothetical protein ACTSYA_04365 [Candidatus Kariarchaeaceae archaeon]